MFFPQQMTEIEMVVPAKDLLAVTKVLSGRAVFHQVDSSYLSSELQPGTANTWQERAAAYALFERRIQNILTALGGEEGQPPTSEFETMTDLEAIRPEVDQTEQEVRKVTEQMSGEHKKVEQLENTLHQLEPLTEIDLDISTLRSPRFLFSVLGTMPVENMERLQTSLSRVPNVFLPLQRDNQKAVVWLAGAKNNADVLERAARSAYLNPFSLPEDYQGTPSQIIVSLNNNIQELQKSIGEEKIEIARLRKNYEQRLQSLLWDVRSSRMMTDAIVRYGRLQYTYLIVGWVAADDLADLTQRIKQVSKETLVETYPTRRGVSQNVPVALKNPKFLRPFQMLVTTYGRPRYDEVDPTVIMAVMFPLLFGVMFGDVGQGLVLVFLGWLLANKRVKALRSMAGLGGVIGACGAVSTVFGFLYGSIFGFEHLLPAIWMRPVENILTILGIAIGGGVVLLSIAFLLGIYNAWMARDWGRLLFDPHGIAGLVLYWSLLGLVGAVLLPNFPVPQAVFVVTAILSGVAVMLSELFKHLVEGHRPLLESGVGVYAIQAFFELFETVISFLSNSLSYVRVGAFAVAHGGLSAAIFLLAELISPGHGIGYYIVILGGNVFIIGLEGLIVGIQTMRLSYYEFFGKFFTGGGMRYEPLTLRPVIED